MYKFCIVALVALSLSAANGSFLEDALENVGYMALKEALIANGDTEFHADCFVKLLKATGTTEDFANIITGPDATLQKIKNKFQFADFVCSPPGLIAMALLFIFIFVVCCCCCIRWMCSTKEPIIIQMPSSHTRSHSTTTIPYVKMDVV